MSLMFTYLMSDSVHGNIRSQHHVVSTFDIGQSIMPNSRVAVRSSIVVNADPESICRHIRRVPVTSGIEAGPRLSPRRIGIAIAELFEPEISRAGEARLSELVFPAVDSIFYLWTVQILPCGRRLVAVRHYSDLLSVPDHLRPGLFETSLDLAGSTILGLCGPCIIDHCRT
jgi:hypothetical protein